jgi:hypothetical protein
MFFARLTFARDLGPGVRLRTFPRPAVGWTKQPANGRMPGMLGDWRDPISMKSAYPTTSTRSSGPPRLTFLRPDPAESARSPLSLSRRFNEVVDLEEVSR